jgi:AhpD family alkylhydroperoxidase
MYPRITNPALLVPGAMESLQALSHVVEGGPLPASTVGLVHLRASQLNGCVVCLDGHAHLLQKAGETQARMVAVADWRGTTCFTDAERAALALTEVVTRLDGTDHPVPDAVWDEAARHYDEQGLASLVLAIATINVWNRLNLATEQVPGVWRP